MSERQDLKKRMEKRNHDKNKRKLQRQKKDKALVRIIGQYEVDFDKSLGKGQFGNVYRANKAENSQEVFACKHISEKRMSSEDAYEQNLLGKSIKERLMDQINVHKSLGDCEHIVKLYDIREEKDGYYLFMEMCESDLGKRIKSVVSFQQPEALHFFKQLLKGYKQLFDRKISHRDLKPENLLLLGDQLKIADFGFVKVSEDIDLITRSQQKSQFMAQSVVGSINYIAPDVLRAEQKNAKYNPFKSDVWSMGIILYKMLFGKQPYKAPSKSELLQQIQKQQLIIPAEPKISEKTLGLLKNMIQKNEKSRYDFMMVYEKTFDGGSEPNKGKSEQMKATQLQFYNQLMTKISYDSANHATFREIGIEDYNKFSSQLMTLIHQRRQRVLEDEHINEDVDQSIKNQIAYYNNTFYYAIKQTAEIEKQKDGKNAQKMLLRLLKTYHDKLAIYQDFDMLHKNVQYFLLLLLQLYQFETKSVTMGFISTMMKKQKANKMTLSNLQKIRKTSLASVLSK